MKSHDWFLPGLLHTKFPHTLLSAESQPLLLVALLLSTSLLLLLLLLRFLLLLPMGCFKNIQWLVAAGKCTE